MNYQIFSSSKCNNKGFLVCLLIPLLCVFRYYESPIGLLSNRLSIGIMIIMVALIPLLTRKRTFPINHAETNRYIIFCFVIIGCYLLSLILYNFVAAGALLVLKKQLYVLLVALLCVYCFWGYINHQLLVKIYVELAILFALLGIIQWLFGLIGVGIDMKIPLLQYYNDGEKFTLFSQMNTFTHVPSVFAEASHFAAFLLPAIIFLLAGYSRKLKLFKLAILIGGVVASTSANGLICLAIIVISYTYFSQKGLKPVRLLIGIFLLYIIVIILLSGVLNEILEGVFSSSTLDETKADYRIYRGFELFSELPLHQKIFGIGNANIHSFYTEGLMHSEFDRTWRAIDFLSAFSSIIIYNGFVGLLAFVFFIKSLWNKTNWATKTIILVFLAYSISEDFYFNEFWLLYIALICSARYIFSKDNRTGQINYEKNVSKFT